MSEDKLSETAKGFNMLTYAGVTLFLAIFYSYPFNYDFNLASQNLIKYIQIERLIISIVSLFLIAYFFSFKFKITSKLTAILASFLLCSPLFILLSGLPKDLGYSAIFISLAWFYVISSLAIAIASLFISSLSIKKSN
jgi:hypothetical protein